MKLHFKHQKFQADAARAVVDVFAGQPCAAPAPEWALSGPLPSGGGAGWRNAPLVPGLTDAVVLEQLNRVQRRNQLHPSPQLEGRFNLTVEMETGVGKTYTYIKTMYELNAHYGWSKFIVVVPSVAIREGVYKTFEMTQDHFAGDYGKKIRFFIYNSAQLTQIDSFACDSSIYVMIINAQAFNARGKDARRIRKQLDDFQSRRPIDIIAGTNPILIIDEPQSVEGRQTRERLKEFNPLFTLRYSATHRAGSVYNMVYRLDAMEAYNRRLVKKITVKGITEIGSAATNGYVYLESVNLSRSSPTATIQFDCRSKRSLRKRTVTVGVGANLYEQSGELEEYRDGFVVTDIDGRDNSLEFANGIRLCAGDVVGKVSEEQLRRIQIRETILTHLQRERQLFHRGIKVLSLFFIDEVAKYRQYDQEGNPSGGLYARMFEEEYNDVVGRLQRAIGDEGYLRYLDAIPAAQTHAGYFSKDNKGKLTDSKLSDRRVRTSDDTAAYDLIMRNKELLLERDPSRSPVRFIFSHSALREGWDNPNVFQICTLKQSASDVRKRQEVGRGMRLCVDQSGERMDVAVLGAGVHEVNVLTVIASESYDSFARQLQTELADAIAGRPTAITPELFKDRVIWDSVGNEQIVDSEMAQAIYFEMAANRYIDKKGLLTERYYEEKAAGRLRVAEEVEDCEQAVLQIVEGVYDARLLLPENARDDNVEITVDPEKMAMPEFQELWRKISGKSVYTVDFDTSELVRRSVAALNRDLRVPKTLYKVETGSMQEFGSRETLLAGRAFIRSNVDYYEASRRGTPGSVRYDLVGKLVEETGLTRAASADILSGIEPVVFDQFKDNPEEFILRAAVLINAEKALAITEHITYRPVGGRYSTDIFTNPTLRGRLNINVMPATKHLYSHVPYDSVNERDFAAELELNDKVAVYVKLPSGFYIDTPLGRYTPDWAIAFREGTAKHIRFVAETKGAQSSLQLRLIEEGKVHCARAHFKAVCGDDVTYDVVDSWDTLLERVL